MTLVRFNPLFLTLMSAAAASAFLIPGRFSDRFAPQLQMLFWPVARPMRALTMSIAGRDGPDLPPDSRSSFALREENQQLIEQNIKLRHDVEELAKINDERNQFGELRPLCTPIAVLGGDAGTRESLAVGGSSLQGLKDGMYVLSSTKEDVQIVGTLQRSGLLGGQVQLITNPGFRVQAYFAGLRRIEPAPPGPGEEPGKTIDAYVRLNREPVLVEGIGKQQMVVRLLKAVDSTAWALHPGDYVVLDDPDWPTRLRGKRIGRVSEVLPNKDKALFVEVHITPLSDLLKLREVMVLREK